MAEFDKYVEKQYVSASGIKSYDENDTNDADKFISWTYRRGVIGKEYRKFAESNGIIFDSSHSAEVNKCYLDTLIRRGSNGNTISPCRLNMQGNYTKALFKPICGQPILLMGSQKMPLPEGIIDIMTHNPYEFEDMEEWGKLHQSGLVNIVVGVYGSKRDKDRYAKMRQMDVLKASMHDNYRDIYWDDQKNYYYILATRDKVKVKTIDF